MTAVIIGFVNESVDAAVPGSSLTICVAILDPKPPDIDPMRRIPIEILVSTVNTATGMSNIIIIITDQKVWVCIILQIDGLSYQS